jgi:photosystem II stability/assembly factor-like uncharacterized protein
MLRIRYFGIWRYLTSFALVGLLAACGGGSGGGDDGPVFYPDVPPLDVQVVAGEGFDDIALANVISWRADPAATGHTVYWSYTPDVTVNSPAVVPTESTSTYIVHADPTQVFPGETIYYLVVATDGTQVSVPSVVVSGTPQEAVTGNSLKDVAWNGLLDGNIALVAVGDSGTILTSPNGTLDGWEDVDLSLVLADDDVSLAGVTWGNNEFVVVGAGGTVLTSSDGIEWTSQDPGVNTDLEDVAWTGSQYVVVGKNGAVLTSSDAETWTVLDARVDPAITLEAVAIGNGTLVAVGTKGTIITSQNGGANWTHIDLAAQDIDENNDLSDVTWDGSRFGVVGSFSTLLSSSDGINWTEIIANIANYALEGAVQWDPFLPSSLPVDPLLAMVGSSGTFFIGKDCDPDALECGLSVPTNTNQQLEAIIWIDDIDPAVDLIEPYFVMVGHDGTVLTSQYNPQ